MDNHCKLLDNKRLCRRRKINDCSINIPDTLNLVVPRKKMCESRSETRKSLLDLNDDCLRTVLEHLDAVNLCQIANVCTRFNPLTEEIFRRRHKRITLHGCSYEKSTFRRVLYKFGHLISSIIADSTSFGGNTRIDFDAIITHCSTNSISLCVHGAIIDCERAKPLFPKLRLLRLLDCEFVGYIHELFSSCSNLIYFTFRAKHPSHFVAIKFPRLLDLRLANWAPHYRIFSRFLMLNPQLQLLILPLTGNNHISAIAEYAQNLKRLGFEYRNEFPIKTFERLNSNAFVRLGQLKKLNSLVVRPKFSDKECFEKKVS